MAGKLKVRLARKVAIPDPHVVAWCVQYHSGTGRKRRAVQTGISFQGRKEIIANWCPTSLSSEKFERQQPPGSASLDGREHCRFTVSLSYFLLLFFLQIYKWSTTVKAKPQQKKHLQEWRNWEWTWIHQKGFGSSSQAPIFSLPHHPRENPHFKCCCREKYMRGLGQTWHSMLFREVCSIDITTGLLLVGQWDVSANDTYTELWVCYECIKRSHLSWHPPWRAALWVISQALSCSQVSKGDCNWTAGICIVSLGCSVGP